MTSLTDLLSRLRALDVRLTLDGDRLNVSAPKGALTADLRAELSSRKEDIKTLLSNARAEDQSAAIPKVERAGDLPVSHTQQRLWFMKQMDPASSVYNVANAFRMQGRLDAEAFERALRDVVVRHESLRTRFVTIEGAPRCIVEPAPALRLERHDVAHEHPQAREPAAQSIVMEMARRPFDLGRAPLMHLALIRVAEDLHYFCFVLDHIICDGLSIGLFVTDLQAFYAQHVTGRPAQLAPLPVQYVDYAEWQRRWLAGGAMQRQLAYWKEQLKPVTAALQLPADRPRPKVQTFNGARLVDVYPRALVERVKDLARTEGATHYMVLLAAFQALLYRYTGAEVVPVGSATANRSRAEVERLIGFFANNVVLVGDLSGNPTVRELVARVRETALKAYAHQAMPFDVLVDAVSSQRQLDHSPIFQVMFVLHTLLLDRIDLVGLDCKTVEIEIGTSRFDLSVDVFDLPEGLRVYFEYNTDLFDAATMRRMQTHFRRMLEGFVADRNARIGDIAILEPEERDQLTILWNDTARSPGPCPTVHEMFVAQARRTPQAVAVRCGTQSLTYEDLERRANQLARHLQSLGARPDSLVGIHLERSVDMVVALLAVLKSGAAYVPLDPAFPQDRIAYMVQDSGLGIVVTQQELAAALDAVTHGGDLTRVCIDSDWPQIATSPAASPATHVEGGSLAYVIYTSGSTGRPKGVLLEHRSVVNFLASMHREPGMGIGDRLVSVTTLSFDIAALEIFGPLTSGGTVTIANRGETLDGQRLMELIDRTDATIMQATPATWRLLLESGWSGKSDLKILCGGEALPRDLADRLLMVAKEVWNMYGPTETTIWSTISPVSAGASAPDIGRPIANTQVYVLDPQRQPVPIGVAGELYIAGQGVARGYLNRPDLTAERFLPDPFVSVPGARMYRTGDLARWRADGTLECLGRVDQQVKIRGYRIEPGEIETLLASHSQIVQAVVIARPDASGAQRLLAYLVPQPGWPLDPAALRRFLAASLPEYMIPSVFVGLPALPLTPNGKVDRLALPQPDAQTIAPGANYAAPQSELESTVAAIWQDVLGLERVGRNDNFFDLGGHSLLIVRVQSRLQRQLARNIPLIELFRHPTVGAFAEFLAGGDSGSIEIERARDRAARQRVARRRHETTT